MDLFTIKAWFSGSKVTKITIGRSKDNDPYHYSKKVEKKTKMKTENSNFQQSCSKGMKCGVNSKLGESFVLKHYVTIKLSN